MILCATFLQKVVEYADEVLLKTPDLLPVLKQAGVVDSGGQGLMEVLHGALDIFLGKDVDTTINASKAGKNEKKENAESLVSKEIKYGYKTEFVILLNKPLNIKTEQDYKNFLEAMGDSVVMMPSDGNIKVHIHTNDPGLIIQRALKIGMLNEISIENLKLDAISKNEDKKEAEPVKEEPKELKEYGFIAVSAGAGMSEIFKSIGTDIIIEGGQTMNPSTEDMMNAIEKVYAKHVYILPNNKNIIEFIYL